MNDDEVRFTLSGGKLYGDSAHRYYYAPGERLLCFMVPSAQGPWYKVQVTTSPPVGTWCEVTSRAEARKIAARTALRLLRKLPGD